MWWSRTTSTESSWLAAHTARRSMPIPPRLLSPAYLHSPSASMPPTTRPRHRRTIPSRLPDERDVRAVTRLQLYYRRPPAVFKTESVAEVRPKILASVFRCRRSSKTAKQPRHAYATIATFASRAAARNASRARAGEHLPSMARVQKTSAR